MIVHVNIKKEGPEYSASWYSRSNGFCFRKIARCILCIVFLCFRYDCNCPKVVLKNRSSLIFQVEYNDSNSQNALVKPINTPSTEGFFLLQYEFLSVQGAQSWSTSFYGAQTETYSINIVYRRNLLSEIVIILQCILKKKKGKIEIGW